MTAAATLDPAFELAARARLLALGFTAPQMDTLGEMRNLAEALAHDAPAGVEAEALGDLLHAIRDPGVVAEAPSDYSTLFDRDAPCAPYEGSYDGDPFQQVRQMSDIAGFYAAFGAGATGPDSDRPDHVACELEFLSFLALRGLASRMDGRGRDVETCREAEDAFLRDHLGRWLGAFCDRVARTTTSPLYASLARLGSEFAASELGRRGIVPAPLSGPRRWSVEADELTCGASPGGAGDGCGGGCAGVPLSPARPDAA